MSDFPKCYPVDLNQVRGQKGALLGSDMNMGGGDYITYYLVLFSRSCQSGHKCAAKVQLAMPRVAGRSHPAYGPSRVQA